MLGRGPAPDRASDRGRRSRTGPPLRPGVRGVRPGRNGVSNGGVQRWQALLRTGSSPATNSVVSRRTVIFVVERDPDTGLMRHVYRPNPVDPATDGDEVTRFQIGSYHASAPFSAGAGSPTTCLQRGQRFPTPTPMWTQFALSITAPRRSSSWRCPEGRDAPRGSCTERGRACQRRAATSS